MYDGRASTQRVRNREHATRRLLEMLQKIGAVERVAIINTHAPERMAELRSLASAWLPIDKALVADITPVIGAHIGSGVYGFAVVAAAR